MYEIKPAKRLSQALVHSVIARASLFMDCQVYLFVLKIRILDEFASIFWTFLQQIPFLLPYIDGRQCMVLRLCTTAELFYSPVRSIFRRISLHDLPYHRTMKKCLRQVSEGWWAFLSLLQDLGLNQFSVIIYNVIACLAFSLSATKINVVKESCGFSQINVFHYYFPHWVAVLFFPSQFYIVHIHWQEQSFFTVTEETFSIRKLFPNRTSIGFSQIAFPLIVLSKDDRTNSFQEERLGLPYWTMIWVICASVDVSKSLDILTLELFNNVGASSILTGV